MRWVISVACLVVLVAGSGCGKDGDSKAQQRGKTEKSFDAGTSARMDAATTVPGSDGGIAQPTRLDDGPDLEVPALVLE